MIASVAQFGVFALGAVYAVGMLIVNFHLRQYEVVSLDLARPEYVMAGVLWAFLTLIGAGGVHWSVMNWRGRHQQPRGFGFLSWVFAAVGWWAAGEAPKSRWSFLKCRRLTGQRRGSQSRQSARRLAPRCCCSIRPPP
jgi:hypothetical protein